MTLIVGMHFSIAGKYYRAVERANELGCNALQIFAQNPRGWRGRQPSKGEIGGFKSLVSKFEIETAVVHTPYLINLASPNPKVVWRSRQAVKTSLERADLLGAQFVVTHIGSARGRDLDDALKAVSRGLDEVLGQKYDALLLLENSAGSGHIVGRTIAELARIIERCKYADRLYVCLDTAHAFAAGYDVATLDGLDATLLELDELVGLSRLKVVHANDTKAALGSHVDRHYHIGKGKIGVEGFRNIVNHPKLAHLPFILETPVDDSCDDVCNLRAFRSLISPQRRRGTEKLER